MTAPRSRTRIIACLGLAVAGCIALGMGLAIVVFLVFFSGKSALSGPSDADIRQAIYSKASWLQPYPIEIVSKTQCDLTNNQKANVGGTEMWLVAIRFGPGTVQQSVSIVRQGSNWTMGDTQQCP